MHTHANGASGQVSLLVWSLRSILCCILYPFCIVKMCNPLAIHLSRCVIFRQGALEVQCKPQQRCKMLGCKVEMYDMRHLHMNYRHVCVCACGSARLHMQDWSLLIYDMRIPMQIILPELAWLCHRVDGIHSRSQIWTSFLTVNSRATFSALRFQWPCSAVYYLKEVGPTFGAQKYFCWVV